MSEVIAVNADNFAAEVTEWRETTVVVDFWAPWCGYCTKLLPVLDELAAETGGKLKIVKVNVDEQRELAQRYGVMSLPTLLLFKQGEEADKWTGFMPKADLLAKLQPHM